MPQVCVIVSAYNRADLLAELVAALAAQTLHDFEAVLVDNGSTDGTHDALLRLTAGDARFRVVRLDDNRGPARARNLAWRSTAAPWVAFTDDDCAPRPTWLAELRDAAASAGADFVQGRTIPAPYRPGQRRGWFDRSQRIVRWSGRFETCNLLVSRTVLERHEGFNERFRIAMGEDTDLGLRATAAGAVTAFATDAVVEHHNWPCGFREYLHQRRRYSELVELMRVNPSARGLLRGGYVLRGVHLLVWGLPLLVAASLWVGAPWVPVAAAMAWVALNTYRTRKEPFPLWSRIGFSGLHLVAYAYETACFAVASVRYRSLVI